MSRRDDPTARESGLETPGRLVRGCIDRIEGSTAVLVLESGAALQLPTSLLPPGAGEGDWLTLALSLDSRSGSDARRRVESARRAAESRQPDEEPDA